MLITWRTPLDTPLCSYILHWPVLSPWFNLRWQVFRVLPRSGNQAATLVGRDYFQAYHFKPGALPCLHRRYLALQPVPALSAVAPLWPRIYRGVWDEPLLRELINQSTSFQRNICEALQRKNDHLQNLMSDLSKAELPKILGPLHLPALTSISTGYLALSRTLHKFDTSPKLGPDVLGRCSGGIPHHWNWCPAVLDSCGISVWQPRDWGFGLGHTFWDRLSAESPSGAPANLTFLALSLAAPLGFSSFSWRSRMPTFSASASSFRGLSLIENKCSAHLAGVLLVSERQESCSAAPCGALEHRRSLLLQTSLEFLF